jgi:hypothetical protein
LNLKHNKGSGPKGRTKQQTFPEHLCNHIAQYYRIMKTNSERKKEYKNQPVIAGVFQIKNLVNGKTLLGSSLNLHGPLNRHKFMLQIGLHSNEELMSDWKLFGEENFVFEILEIVPQNELPGYDYSEDLEILEQIWIDRVQPFGEKGYNKNTNLKQSHM